MALSAMLISHMETLAKKWYRNFYRVALFLSNQVHRPQSNTLAHCSPSPTAFVPDDNMQNKVQSIGPRVPSLEEHETVPEVARNAPASGPLQSCKLAPVMSQHLATILRSWSPLGDRGGVPFF